MRIGVIDIETNAINDWTNLSDLETIHCLCLYDTHDQKVHRYNSQCKYPMLNTIREGLEHAAKCDLLVAHNGIGFDFPALEQLLGFKHPNTLDTLIMARCIYPDVRNQDFQRENFDKKLIGSHSLKAWGTRIGKYKGDFGEDTDWQTWSKSMEDYCVQDVMVTMELYFYLMNKNPSQQMLKLEHKFASIIKEQEKNGFPFDVEKAEKLICTLMLKHVGLLEELRKIFPPKIEQMKSRLWVNEFNGVTFQSKKDAILAGYKHVIPGDYKTKEIPFNPNSRDQIAERLMEAGWKPKAYDGKRPAINEAVLKEIGTEQSEKLLEYLTITKRLGQLADGNQAWLKAERNGRIYGKVNTNGTVSGRCSHNNPNLAQVPATSAPFGAECRELFTVPDGKVLVGCDASGLELRCLAHYLHAWDNGAYGKKIVEDDIHTVNQKAAGLQTRNQAKTFIYAWLYGAGDAKIGSIVGGNSKQGKELKTNFTKKLPAVKNLLDAVSKKVEATGVLLGLDGRDLPTRSPHSALNLLLQSAGAVVMKQALVEFVGIASRLYEMHANVHDEVQFSCLEEDAEVLGEEFVQAIKLAGHTLNFKCPLDGEYHIGKTWKETH
jgi:DNA polymerase-1